MRTLQLVTNQNAECFKRQVSALEELGVSTTTLSPRRERRHTEEGVDTRSVGDYAAYYSRAFMESFRGYDLVHANFGLTAPPAVAQWRLPVVISLWGTDLLGEYGWVSKLSARFADAVIVMSDQMAAELGQPCHVIPYGIDFEQFTPQPTETAKRQVGWDPDVYHVLFPYPKTQAVKDYPRAQRIVDRAARRLSTAVELEVVHGVAYERMPVYMNAGDLLLLTSKHEGSPSTVKEALACNLPVVSTPVGDVPQLIADVDRSTIARTDDDLVDGVVDALRGGERATNGRESVRGYSIEATGSRIHGIYQRLLGHESATPVEVR